LNISDNPGTLDCHDDLPSIDGENLSLDLQDSKAAHSRKSHPLPTARSLEPFGQKAITHTLRLDVLNCAVTKLEVLIRDSHHNAT
jgi:hypothetical protein